MEQFKIPVVLFTFKRTDTVLRIISVLRLIKPKKMYIFSDGPRNLEEKQIIEKSRQTILTAIDWDCVIIKEFADENKGIFNQIGLGADKVFDNEETAIFLEDDNLPEITFFRYCEELLDKYSTNNQVLWICGTNYETESAYLESSYVFTQEMLPCGWASWSKKYKQFYLKSFELLSNPSDVKILKRHYQSKALYRQQMRNFKSEYYREKHGMRFASWDFHMACTIRYYNLYGIAPKYNQIRNIGVDNLSTHGGTTMKKPNTSNFCEIPTRLMEFPLVAPKKIVLNDTFESITTSKILAPIHIRILFPFITFFKKLLGLYPNKGFRDLLRKR